MKGRVDYFWNYMVGTDENDAIVYETPAEIVKRTIDTYIGERAALEDYSGVIDVDNIFLWLDKENE
jgi:hypothetical protein